MKLRNLRNRRNAFTFWESVIVIGTLVAVAAYALPALSQARTRSKRIRCVCHHKQVGLAVRMYANDNFGCFPWATTSETGQVSVTSVSAYFLMASNELNNPRILACPTDRRRRSTADFARLTDANIGYFIGLDAKETEPGTILIGDRNLSTNNRILSGQIQLTTTNTVHWTADIHNRSGNIGLGDGSAHQLPNTALQRQVLDHPITPFRLLIP